MASNKKRLPWETIVILSTFVLSMLVYATYKKSGGRLFGKEPTTETSEAPLVVDYHDCRGTQQGQVSFVLECIKNGNPMSDEEPEALVKECHSISITLFCPLRTQVMKRVDFTSQHSGHFGGSFIVDDSGELLSIDFAHKVTNQNRFRR